MPSNNFIRFTLLVLVSLSISCNKKKQKPKWELIPLYDKSETLKFYKISDLYISPNNQIFFILKTAQNEIYTELYHSSDQGESWNRLLTQGGAFGQEIGPFSHTASGNIFINAKYSPAKPHKIIRYDLNTTNINYINLPDELSENLNGQESEIYFINDSVGFLGTYGIWKTADAGLTWTNEGYPYLDKINGIDFTNDNTGYALTPNLCLRTLDAGTNWDTLYTANSESFEKIQMVTANIGIIGGSKIWLTEDAGLSWKVVLDEKIQDISINQNGSIYAISEDYKIFRSIDLGDSWSKRNSQKDGFNSVYTRGNITFAGIRNLFEGNKGDKVIKNAVLIGKLKN